METEIWKDVIGYEGYYQVSNLGNVKGLERVVGTYPQLKTMPEAIKKPWISKKGYYRIQLRKKGVIKAFQLHRLVAQAFIENTMNKDTVNHINGIKADNRVENLEWLTNHENIIHYYKKLKGKK